MYFPTKETTLSVGDLTIALTLVDDLDALFDELIAKGKNHPDVLDERIPYWAELWASAIAMSQYLLEKAIVTEGVSVTEIGCGLGLPSIVAGRLGGNVTLTDYIPEALDFARLNWNKNIQHKSARFKLMDWRNPDSSLAADVLLASDVAYEHRAFQPLMQAFPILTKPNGTIIITEPNRSLSKSFFDTLHQKFLAIQHSTKTIETKGQPFLVNIFEIKLITY